MESEYSKSFTINKQHKALQLPLTLPRDVASFAHRLDRNPARSIRKPPTPFLQPSFHILQAFRSNNQARQTERHPPSTSRTAAGIYVQFHLHIHFS